MMTRQECITQSLQWLAMADEGYNRSKDVGPAGAPSFTALPTLAAAIAQAYATLAIAAEPGEP